MSELKKINQMYIDRITQSLIDDKDKWYREVMCGMNGCFVDYFSPKYKNKNGDMISFSDKSGVSAYLNDKLIWEMNFWDYINPFSERSSKLRKAISEMIRYLDEKETQERLNELKKTIE
jgi:hypothetical protein